MDILKAIKALSNENRLSILEWLKAPKKHFKTANCLTDGVCIGLIEEKIQLSQSTVSQYILQLQQAGFIHTERKGQWTYCRLNEKFIDDFLQALNKIL